MSELISVGIGALVGGIVSPVAMWLVDSLNHRKSKQEATAALRFELASNLVWLESFPDSMIYLRDEAWVGLKNRGYISYLKAPLPMMVARVYERLHTVNGRLREIKECNDPAERAELKKNTNCAISQFRERANKLIEKFDENYPKIGGNFLE